MLDKAKNNIICGSYVVTMQDAIELNNHEPIKRREVRHGRQHQFKKCALKSKEENGKTKNAKQNLEMLLEAGGLREVPGWSWGCGYSRSRWTA
jgi:hypothetical protein